MILMSDFRGKLYGEKGENKNGKAVSRPDTGVSLRLSQCGLAHHKLLIFGGKIDQCIILQITSESHHYELCGKCYGQFAETVLDRQKLCKIVFKPNFKKPIVGIMFCTVNEHVA